MQNISSPEQCCAIPRLGAAGEASVECNALSSAHVVRL